MGFWVFVLLVVCLALYWSWQEKHARGNKVDSDAPGYVKAIYPLLMVLVGALLLAFFALQIIGDPNRVLRGGP